MEIIQKRLLLARKAETGGLPRGYKRVTHLESTGTQYIDTYQSFYYYPSFKVRYKRTSSNYTVFGVLGSQAAQGARLTSSLSTATTDYLTGWYGQNYHASYVSHGWHNVELDTGLLIVDGAEYAFTPRYSGTGFAIVLFGYNNNGTKTPSPVQIASYQSYRNDGDEPVLVRDMIPCYRKADGVAGMYDLCGSICPLTGTPFYINAGTGEFLIGDEI